MEDSLKHFETKQAKPVSVSSSKFIGKVFLYTFFGLLITAITAAVIGIIFSRAIQPVNYTEYEVPYTRIAEHQYFEPGQKHNKTVITKEYSKTWTLGDEAYYPLNNEKNSVLYLKYQELAKENPNIYFGGRLGTYSYYNMDIVVEKALQLVESRID